MVYDCRCVNWRWTRLKCCAYKAAKYSLEPLGSGFMVFSPGFQPAGQTSSGFSCTYWMACRMRSVSVTLRPNARLLIVACWMTPCAQRARAQVNDYRNNVCTGAACAFGASQAARLACHSKADMQRVCDGKDARSRSHHVAHHAISACTIP